MTGGRSRFSRGWLDVPMAAIGCGWIGLWLLWPNGTARSRTTTGASEPRCRVVYREMAADQPGFYMKPDLFGRPSAVGFRASGADDGFSVKALGAWQPIAEGPEDLPFRCGFNGAEGWTSRATPVVLNGPAWGLENEGTPVFRLTTSGIPRLRIDLAPSLRLAGLVAPAIAVDGVRRDPGGWTMWLDLTLDRDGSVREVFVERSSGDARTDAVVARALGTARGRSSPSGGVGRVVVSLVE